MVKFDKTIVVIGATGRQGGAVARSLLRQGQKVRTFTRTPEKAKSLEVLGAEVVVGDLLDPLSLEKAFKGVDGVFGVTSTDDMTLEVSQGKNIVNAAVQMGIGHLVFTSAASTNHNIGIPILETKWQIEQYIQQSEIPSTIIRPVWFMENFRTSYVPTDDNKFYIPLSPNLKLQMVTVKDIGEFGAAAFLRPKDFVGQAVDLAGDVLTMLEVVTQLSRIKNVKYTFEQMPAELVESTLGKPLAVFYEWLNNVGFSVDIAALQHQYGIRLTPFIEWALADE